MIIGKIMSFFLPAFFKRLIRTRINCLIVKIKAPRMVIGYNDTTAGWQDITRISDTTSLYHRENIHIGDNVYIGHFCILDGTDDLIINEGVQLAGWNGVYTHSSHIAIRLYGKHYQEIPELHKIGYKIGKVSIGKYTFIGAGAKIFPGVSIGQGSLITANSVVTRNVEDFQIASGNPAEIIGDARKLDEKYLSDPQLLAWYEEWQKNKKHSN